MNSLLYNPNSEPLERRLIFDSQVGKDTPITDEYIAGQLNYRGYDSIIDWLAYSNDKSSDKDVWLFRELEAGWSCRFEVVYRNSESNYQDSLIFDDPVKACTLFIRKEAGNGRIQIFPKMSKILVNCIVDGTRLNLSEEYHMCLIMPFYGLYMCKFCGERFCVNLNRPEIQGLTMQELVGPKACPSCNKFLSECLVAHPTDTQLNIFSNHQFFWRKLVKFYELT